MAIGNKGFGFLNRIGANVVSHAVQLGDAPQLDKLIGPVKVMLDAFVAGKLDSVQICYTRFINTMKQEPTRSRQLLPLGGRAPERRATPTKKTAYGWDYIYEPDAPTVIDELRHPLRRSPGVPGRGREHGFSEQSARMVAMKAATDNAGSLISRAQAHLQQDPPGRDHEGTESEIVGGAAAV